MKYFEVDFTLSPYSADASDILAALAGEAGFETFEETETGLKGYVQQTLFDEEALKTALADFPFDGITVTYAIREAEDRDWNEQWETEGFEPIVIERKVESGKWKENSICGIIIHDGRHLPDPSLFTIHYSLFTSILQCHSPLHPCTSVHCNHAF